MTMSSTHMDDTQVPKIIFVSVFSMVITYGSVLLRLLSRRLSNTPLKMDDWIICLSLIFTTAYSGLNISLIPVGFGRHEILVTDPARLTKTILAAEVLYTIAIASFKWSLLFLLNRIFPGKRFRHVLIGVGTFIIAYSITQAVCAIFECTPVRRAWDPETPGHCINIDNVFLVCSALTIATDFVILALPMPKLWRLKISKVQKFQLTAIFASGSLVCIISIVRITKLKEVSLVDTSYSDVDGFVWSILEQAIGTLSVCLPTYRCLFQYCLCHTSRKPEGRKAPVNSSYSEQRSNTKRTRGTDGTSDTRPFARLNDEPQDDIECNSYIPMNELRGQSIKVDGIPSNTVAVQGLLDQDTSIRTETSAAGVRRLSL